MKCPACFHELTELQVGAVTVDVCHGGCGGIWFDAMELERVDARAATTLHSIWTIPASNVKLNEPRMCPRCPDRVLDRKWFSNKKEVEIDQCPICRGIWLDAGEFTRVYHEMKGAKVRTPLWAAAMAIIEENSATASHRPNV